MCLSVCVLHSGSLMFHEKQHDSDIAVPIRCWLDICFDWATGTREGGQSFADKAEKSPILNLISESQLQINKTTTLRYTQIHFNLIYSSAITLEPE